MLPNESIAAFPTLSPTSEVIFSTQGQISRWSNTGLSPNGCAMIVVPSTEEDIASVVKFAAGNDLKVMATAGKHGSFLPINERSIYLDLKRFDTLELDESLGCVKIGGGVVAGRMCSELAEQGWYTSHPNSNAVGMVGYVLGGGSSAINGMHSIAIDNLLAVRICTASGTYLTLPPDSPDHEKDLYNVICGAGFGFGVVTSITFKAWRISNLGLTDNKIWTHRMIFPPSAIDSAADLFVQLSKPSPQMATALLFLREPPSAPRPGAPVLKLILTYFGSASSAEKAFKAAFNPMYVARATLANTALANLADLNTATDVLNRHGDYKTNYSTWAHDINSQKIQAGFEHWLRLGDDVPDAQAASYFVVSARDPTAMRAHDLDNEKCFPRTTRERAIFAQAVPWWKDPNNEEACRKWGRDMLDILGDRSNDADKVNGFAANLNRDVAVTEIWPQERLEQIRRLKSIWDPGNIFWNPVVDGM